MIRAVFVAAFVVGALLGPGAGGAGAQADEADAAWNRGDLATAEQLYSARLAADSADVRALHRLGLILAWGGHYSRSLALFDRLVALVPDSVAPAVDRARVLAWQGDAMAAVNALQPHLARDPTNPALLEAQAQFASWARDFDLALESYGRILEARPGDVGVRREQAKVLSWASRHDAAIAAYEALLRDDPADAEARLGLARVLAWSGRYAAAEAEYRRLLADDPANLDALRGLAQTASWRGDLREGERRWRGVLERAPNDVAALVGLAQVLRWQGRHAASREHSLRALALAPADADARAQLAWTEAVLAPRIAPGFVYESDSDGHQIATAVVGTGWHPLPRLQLHADGYARRTERSGGPKLSRRAQGLTLGVRALLEPGWVVAVAGGASGSDAPGAEAIPALRASVTTPARLPLGLSLGYSRAALDATAQQVERGVSVEEVALSGRLSPAAGWQLNGSLARATFRGTEANHRLAGHGEIARRLGRPWTLLLTARAFGFERDLDDGYWDPRFYALAELGARWQQELGRWALLGEVAPGLQQIGREGERTGTVRSHARLARLLGPGREAGISAFYSTTGMQSFSIAESGYRYLGLSVSASWAF